MFLPIIFREADTDADPQGGSSLDGKQRPTDVLDRFGRDALKLAEKLAEALSDNYTLREQRRTLRQEVTDLKTKVPADGAVILTKEDALLLDSYRALGKPSDLKTAIDANGSATAELSALKREKTLAQAADAAGFKASVLATLAGDLDIQTKEKDGKPVAVVVKDGAETVLTDYATQAWADFLPALKQNATPAPQSYDINAGARGAGAQSKQDIIDANRQRLAQRAGRY